MKRTLAAAIVVAIVFGAAYAAHDEVNWSMGIPLAIGGLLSISWGVKLAHALPDRLLRKLFCHFLLVCAAGLVLIA